MKYKRTFFSLVFASIYLISGCITKATAQDNTIDTAQLVLQFNAKYTGSIGWGDVYKCKVNKVYKGIQEDTLIFLYIIVNNYDSIFFEKISKQGKKRKNAEFQLIAFFKEIENDKPYVNFKNAFIDQKKRTWKLIDLKKYNN